MQTFKLVIGYIPVVESELNIYIIYIIFGFINYLLAPDPDLNVIRLDQLGGLQQTGEFKVVDIG